MQVVAFLLGTFLILLLMGMPFALAMGGSAFLYILFFMNISPLMVVQQMYQGVNSFTLLALPLFIMAGALMEYGGISKRLVKFCMALVGHLPSGLAIVVVVASSIFAAMTGSAVATTAAIGAIMIPEMYARGYDKDFACALQGTAGIVGPLIPPSIAMVVYAVNTNQSVGEMLLAGAGPGLLMSLGIVLIASYICKKNGYTGSTVFSWKEVGVTFLDAIWALLSPIIILGGIYSGVFTPTEAAGVSCFYSLIIGVFIYRELKFAEMIRALGRAIKSTGNIMLIVASSYAFAFVLSRERVATDVATWMLSLTSSKYVFTLFVIVIMLIAGCFIDAVPTIMILAPLFAAMAQAYGMSLVHLGGFMVTATSIGQITPPFGLNLFMGAQVGNRPLHTVMPKIVPFIITAVVVLLIVAYVPGISLLFPSLLR